VTSVSRRNVSERRPKHGRRLPLGLWIEGYEYIGREGPYRRRGGLEKRKCIPIDKKKTTGRAFWRGPRIQWSIAILISKRHSLRVNGDDISSKRKLCFRVVICMYERILRAWYNRLDATRLFETAGRSSARPRSYWKSRESKRGWHSAPKLYTRTIYINNIRRKTFVINQRTGPRDSVPPVPFYRHPIRGFEPANCSKISPKAPILPGGEVGFEDSTRRSGSPQSRPDNKIRAFCPGLTFDRAL